MAEKIAAIKGMNDILPADSYRWEWLEEKVRNLMQRYAFRNIRTPIVESTALFVRGLGEVTDVVEKEMYSFEDKLSKEALTLRPENTAGIVRATVEHSLLYDGGKRLYYFGAMFRHERPQRGRYRQFHQVGAEILGFPNPEVDAELIILAHQLWQELGLKNIRLELNSLGQAAERLQHRQALISYFEQHAEQLDEDAKRRLHSNPLRILDTKNPAMQALVNQAPRLIDYLGAESKQHLQRLQEILDANGVAWSFNPRLVRGLDYYNLTVFEFVTDQLGSQGTVCAGGRYDSLIAQVGGKDAAAVGWALGVERVLELLKEQEVAIAPPQLDVYLIIPSAAGVLPALALAQQLRQNQISVQMHSSVGLNKVDSMKSQFKKADASGAKFALIFGEQELQTNSVTLKSLRDGVGEQSLLAQQDIAAMVQRITI